MRFEWVNDNVGFEVLTAVVMKSSVFRDITPCSPLKVNSRFGGTCRLHLQGRRRSQVRKQGESKWQGEGLPTAFTLVSDIVCRLGVLLIRYFL
jgi:hypothetical protein